jgi:hypothetical protein
MSQPLTEMPFALDEEARRALKQAVDNLVTEDEEPVDSLFSAKQQRLLVEPLYSSWTPPPSDDPGRQLSKDALRVYELGFGKRYRRRDDYQLPEVGLSLKLWRGVFEGVTDVWLRWCGAQGKLIPTGAERAARAEAEAERLRAELARLRKRPAKKRAE